MLKEIKKKYKKSKELVFYMNIVMLITGIIIMKENRSVKKLQGLLLLDNKLS